MLKAVSLTPTPPSPLYIQGKEARKVIFEEIGVHGVVSLHYITSVTRVELPGELQAGSTN